MAQVLNSITSFLSNSPPPTEKHQIVPEQTKDTPAATPAQQPETGDMKPPGTECGDYGKRLVVSVVDEHARRNPDRVWATISRSPYTVDEGFCDISYRELANAVNAAAWNIHELFGKSDNFDVIAYLGVSDVRYGVFTFACIKTGCQIMVPSVRNAISQHVAVFQEASCNKVYYTPEMKTTIETLQKEMPGLQAIPAPTLEEMIAAKIDHYEYNRTFAEGRTDPIVIAHSSGSTGNPKPTTMRNSVYSTYDNHRNMPQVPGRKCQGYTQLNLDMGRFFNPFPPFHMAGLFAMTLMPVLYDCTVTLGPEEKPPSGEIVSQAMKKLPDIKAAWCPPAVIEQLVGLPGGFEQVSSLKWIMYTGGPLSPDVGDRICHVTDVCQMIGSTETGPHAALIPLPENWNYFEWHPELHNEMVDRGDGTFEMVCHKDPSRDWISHWAAAYPDMKIWKTNDLFVQAPHNPKLWKFAGRGDDVLVLSNGEKFNPVNMEAVVNGHELVKGALIVGTARFQASLIIEPAPEAAEMSTEQLIDTLWPTIERANTAGPAHGRIFRSKVCVATTEKPFVRAGKGTVIRGRTTKLYAEEVAKLYDEETEDARAPKLETPLTADSVTIFVRAAVGQLMPSDSNFGDEDDLFVLGMDSLQTLELIKTIKRAAEKSGSCSKADSNNLLTVAGMYTHPTVTQLSRYLLAKLTGQEAEGGGAPAVDRTEVMKQMVDRNTADLPGHQYALDNIQFQHETNELPTCVAITGSTGYFGTHLLERFLKDSSIKKIFCLDRSPGALEKHRNTFASRGKNYFGTPEQQKELHNNTDVECLVVKYGEPDLGLTAEQFSDLSNSVDAVIHNAWKVDFNHQLSSFEEIHIRGVRHIANLCLDSPRRPRLFFISSLSAVGNWAEVADSRSNTLPAPEEIVLDYAAALPLGYGESKHVAERILARAATQSGLRATILRVGQIGGPLAREGAGEWHRTEWFPTLVKSSLGLKVLPDGMNTIDYVPVDSLAAIAAEIVAKDCRDALASGAGSGGLFGVYNLTNPHEADWNALVPAIKGYAPGGALKTVPFAEWLAALREAGSEHGAVDRLPALKLVDFYEGYAAEAALPREKRVRYSTARSEASSKSMAELGPIDEVAMETWLQQWKF